MIFEVKLDYFSQEKVATTNGRFVMKWSNSEIVIFWNLQRCWEELVMKWSNSEIVIFLEFFIILRIYGTRAIKITAKEMPTIPRTYLYSFATHSCNQLGLAQLTPSRYCQKPRILPF